MKERKETAKTFPLSSLSPLPFTTASSSFLEMVTGITGNFAGIVPYDA